MADHELIRETMVSLGEGMEDCGYDAVLETVEGNGVVGKAVRNPRESDQLRIIILYLKDLAKTIKAERPSAERTQAMQLLQEAWETIRAAVHEEEDEAMEKTRKENAPLPERPRALPPVARPTAAVVVAPVPAAMKGQKPQRPQPVVVAPVPMQKQHPAHPHKPQHPGQGQKPQQRPIQGSAGNHYFRSR